MEVFLHSLLEEAGVDWLDFIAADEDDVEIVLELLLDKAGVDLLASELGVQIGCFAGTDMVETVV